MLLRVKKHSEGKSDFCIGTQLRFTVSEVDIAAIVWFINTQVLFNMINMIVQS